MRKKIGCNLCVTFMYIFLFSCDAFCSKQAFAQGRMIAPGIEYVHLTPGQKHQLSVHVLKIDPTKAAIVLNMAGDMCLGKRKTSEQAKERGAIAAINGGFCDERGIPAGVCKIGKKWFTAARRLRAALGWMRDGSAFFIDKLETEITLTICNNIFPVSQLNQARRDNMAIIYTSCFAPTTQTNNRGTEVIVKNNIVQEIRKNGGNSIIPEDGFVYSIGNDFVFDGQIQVGMPVKFELTPIASGSTKTMNWQDVDFIIGGAPVLIADGKKITDFSQEKILRKFEQDCFARTAVGILDDGNILFVVVDNNGVKSGVTLAELADLLESFGCMYAINLCGGKSSTFYLDGKIQSQAYGFFGLFCDFVGLKLEKEVSSTLVVVPRD